MYISYLGPQGSYSSCLVEQLFPDNKAENFVPLSSFLEIYHYLVDTKNSIAVIPIENSITSNVHENIELLFNRKLRIIGEAYLSIALHALALDGASLQTLQKIYSHPKALAQCSEWLKKHDLEAVAVSSTATARDRVLLENDIACGVVGASVLEASSSLKIVAKNVANERRNMTRFVCVTTDRDRSLFTDEPARRMSIVFKTPHTAGALVHVLQQLANAGLNLTKIESSPIPGSDFDYQFLIDFDMHDCNEDSVINILSDTCKEFEIIGLYPQGKTFVS